ncbi:hypothetical protein WJX82_003346 [Trebouxia sp. C0006]
MCGIFGYCNFGVGRSRKAVLELLFTGLRRLEYRGYDSAGVCVDKASRTAATAVAPSQSSRYDSVNLDDSRGLAVKKRHALQHRILQKPETSNALIIKSAGNIDALETQAKLQLTNEGVDENTVLDNHAGIAHTRWATHGPPEARNSHPHTSDPLNEFTVVHNGIITNYKTIKELLEKNDAVFESDTDTEVVPKLLKYVYSKIDKLSHHQPTLPALVMEVMSQLEGAFALLIKSSHYPGELVAAKRGSPLIMGIRQGSITTLDGAVNPDVEASAIGKTMELFLASDASAVVEHTNTVLILEDHDCVHVANGSFEVFNAHQTSPSKSVQRVHQILNLEVNHIMKGGYDHFMQKEIHEQPETLARTMQGRIAFDQSAQDDKVVNPFGAQRVVLGGLQGYLPAIRRSRRMVFVACGTSYHAALACRQTVEELTDIPVSLELASDLLDRLCPIFRDDAYIFVSQSGETADTLRALRYAKNQGALCIGITNTVGSAIARDTDCGININAGFEIGVASTKAYTSQIVAITMMALALSEDSQAKAGMRDDIITSLEALPGVIREVLKLDGDIQMLAQGLKDSHSLLLFGRGYNYATALEAALKVKELVYMHSEGILAGEMKHGPLALVDEHMPMIVLATQDQTCNKMHSVVQQLRARGACPLVVCNAGDDQIAGVCEGGEERLIRVPKVADALQPIVNIVPLQLLSYHLTVQRGFNVDQPRNLAKSVTVTEE